MAFLGGIGHTDGIKSMWGVTLAMSSGLLYAIYMVLFPNMRIRKLPALKVNFYIFFMAMLLLILYATIYDRRGTTNYECRLFPFIDTTGFDSNHYQ